MTESMEVKSLTSTVNALISLSAVSGRLANNLMRLAMAEDERTAIKEIFKPDEKPSREVSISELCEQLNELANRGALEKAVNPLGVEI